VRQPQLGEHLQAVPGEPADPPDSGRRAALVGTLTVPPAANGAGWPGPPSEVTGLEVRADLVGDVDPALLRRGFPGPLCYTLRSTAAGGRYGGSPASRHERLVRARARYDLVDLEAGLDLTPELLAEIPPQQRRVSWHGDQGTGRPVDVAGLADAFAQLVGTPARLYLLAPGVTSAEEALAALLLLGRLRRPDVTAFGAGPAGTWSRLLAPWFGAPVVYGRLGGADAGGPGADGPDTDGLPGIDQLRTDYPLPALPPLQFVCGIVGKAVAGSLSPRLHNAAYRALHLPGLYLPFHVDSLERFWSAVVEHLDELGIAVHGVTVASPHKEAALRVADAGTAAVRAVGAANALVRLGGRAQAASSEGALRTLVEARIPTAGRKVAVIGCGGAGRAVAHGLLAAGAEPTLVNRGAQRGRFAADLLGLPFVPLADFDPAGYALLVNATPLRAESPVRVADLDADTAVLDFVYGTAPTALVRAARDRRLTTVDGLQVLLAEVEDQFWLLTGRRMPDLTHVVRPRDATTPANGRK
jgi:3-dehydroquinate dehydratase/shikimate dehydrogenase